MKTQKKVIVSRMEKRMCLCPLCSRTEIDVLDVLVPETTWRIVGGIRMPLVTCDACCINGMSPMMKVQFEIASKRRKEKHTDLPFLTSGEVQRGS